MVNGFIKTLGVCSFLWLISVAAYAEYAVSASALVHDVKDLSERNSKVLDQNGERCALIKFETVIPKMFTFNLGAQQIEKRVNKEDEIWMWVSADVKKMTIRCTDCTPLKDYRVSLKPGNVYRVKLTTGMPVETSTTQYLNLYCEQVPFQVSIDGAEPLEQTTKNFVTELPIGVHNVRVSSRYFVTYSSDIRLERSRAFSDTIVLEKNYGELAVHANLTNYEVMIDGESRPFTSTYRVEPGMHYVTLTKEKYLTIQDTVMITLGQRTDYSIKFLPAFTVVSISTREPKTEIWVDDELRGHDKVNIELMYGYHRIEGRREGYDTWEYPVHEFTSQSDRNISIPKLNQQFGAIQLSVFPQDATVHLDGVQVNSANGVYTSKQLPVGLHFVYIRMTDYHSVRDSIIVEPSKITSLEYHLEHIPLGIISLRTDPGIAVFLMSENNDSLFLGTQLFSGKLPAGENVIMLKNTSGDKCYHHVFVTEGVVNAETTLPFFRNVMFRSNVSLQSLNLKSDNRVQPVKFNKKLSLSPLCYAMSVSKKGYCDYVDTLDLSKPDANGLIYQVTMRKLGDTTSIAPSTGVPNVFQKYYANAGRWFIGVFNFGYTYSFVDNTHIVSVGTLSLRWKMLGLSLLNFDIPVYGQNQWNVLYNPKVSLILPFSKGGAFTFYGGLNINATTWYKQKKEDPSLKVPIYARGGISLLANKSGKTPFEIFGEYRAPIMNDNTEYNKTQLFRVGINFMFGIDK